MTSRTDNPALTDQQLREVVGLIEGADGVELKQTKTRTALEFFSWQLA